MSPNETEAGSAKGSGGPIALVGGNEFNPPALDLDAWLLERASTKEVHVVPTAAALQDPERAIQTARRHFKKLGATVVSVMVMKRQDAEDSEIVGALDQAQLIYFTGGNPRRTVKVLGESLAWEKTIDAWSRGAVLAGSSAGAMIMCEKMLVPRWKVPVDGLNLLPGTMVVPHHDAWIKRIHRVTKSDVARGLNLYGVDECTGLIIDKDRAHVLGPGSVTLYNDGEVIWSREAPWEGVFT